MLPLGASRSRRIDCTIRWWMEVGGIGTGLLLVLQRRGRMLRSGRRIDCIIRFWVEMGCLHCVQLLLPLLLPGEGIKCTIRWWMEVGGIGAGLTTVWRTGDGIGCTIRWWRINCTICLWMEVTRVIPGVLHWGSAELVLGLVEGPAQRIRRILCVRMALLGEKRPLPALLDGWGAPPSPICMTDPSQMRSVPHLHD